MEDIKMLKFIGNGSCFNTDFGNNAAYYIDEKAKSMLLLDCGESIFERLKKQKILDQVEDISVLVTHLHSDHAGSLPSLLFFCEYAKGVIPTVIYPETNAMKSYLSLVGNEPQAYQIITPKECEKYRIQEVKQQHSEYISAYGYVLEIAGKRMYYSGDTKTIPPRVMQAFRNGQIDEFYQDVSRFETPAHMNIETLQDLFLPEERKKITCMHFDDSITRDKAEYMGFSIARVNGARELAR